MFYLTIIAISELMREFVTNTKLDIYNEYTCYILLKTKSVFPSFISITYIPILLLFYLLNNNHFSPSTYNGDNKIYALVSKVYFKLNILLVNKLDVSTSYI
jgi:hypothetical protein